MMKIWDIENTKFYLLLLYCVFLAYFFPSATSRIGFLPILLFVYRSKSNAPWLVLLLVLADNPAYLFFGTARDAVGRAPIYPLVGGVSIAFTDLIIFTLIIKSRVQKLNNIIYKKELLQFGWVFAFAMVATLPFGVNLDAIALFYRQFIFLILIAFIPKIMREDSDWLQFFRLLFPIIFISLFSQFNTLLTGRPLAALLNPNVTIKNVARSVSIGSTESVRNLSGAVLNFIIFSSSISLLTIKRRVFTINSYLYWVFFAAFLQIIMSATRGWVIAYTVIFLALLIIEKKVKVIKVLFIICVISIFTFLMIQTSDIFSQQLYNSFNRIATLGNLAKGDLSAGGSLVRIDTRLPKLLDNLRLSPIIGFGFSHKAKLLGDTHIGLLNPIINFGIIGYIIILISLLTYNLKLNIIYKAASRMNPFRDSVRMSIASFLALFILHSTSRQIFGVNIASSVNLIVPFVFGITNWLAVSCKKYEKK